MARPKKEPVYVTHEQAAAIIGVSAPRVTQLVSSGALKAPRYKHRQLLLEDVQRIHRQRIKRLVGARPNGFITVIHRDQLTLLMDANDVAHYLDVPIAQAKSMIGGILRIADVRGRTTYTLGAEVEAKRAEISRSKWRAYQNRVSYAAGRHNLGAFNTEAELEKIQGEIVWLENHEHMLREVAERYLRVWRERIQAEMTERPPFSMDRSRTRTTEELFALVRDFEQNEEAEQESAQWRHEVEAQNEVQEVDDIDLEIQQALASVQQDKAFMASLGKGSSEE